MKTPSMMSVTVSAAITAISVFAVSCASRQADHDPEPPGGARVRAKQSGGAPLLYTPITIVKAASPTATPPRTSPRARAQKPRTITTKGAENTVPWGQGFYLQFCVDISGVSWIDNVEIKAYKADVIWDSALFRYRVVTGAEMGPSYFAADSGFKGSDVLSIPSCPLGVAQIHVKMSSQLLQTHTQFVIVAAKRSGSSVLTGSAMLFNLK